MIPTSRVDALYLEAVALVMTAAAQALDAHAALRTAALLERVEDHTAALQQYQACLDALVDAVHNYERLATVKAVLEHLSN